jgi:hypothetical protein
MRSIKARFNEQEQKNPFHGASINLVRAVRGKKFSRQNLLKAFNELMPDEEYDKADKKELIDFLELTTNTLEENEKRGKNQFKECQNQKCDKDIKGLAISEISLKI